MSQPTNQRPNHSQPTVPLKSAAITDRGLSEKRPLNEDSFLADSARGIFSVADGVGGAEAGEVASKTAIEVLDEAFRHHVDGADIEDLMELAIQRANASIHQMAQEHAKFSMMATTIVGLHLNGNVATIGHVGDSRLYRLTPAGQLLRETEDHSVVEEEVRAGRMTAEQAAHHPSKNVISRALGAESFVEVDMKVIEVDEGTEFLLCTDGITRHIPDHELRHVLLTSEDLATACEELKRRCFERGAEDNLTAVLVCVGDSISARQRSDDLEKTISPETDPGNAIAASPDAAQTMMGSSLAATDSPETVPAFIPASRRAFPATAALEAAQRVEVERRAEAAPRPRSRGGVERTMTRFFLFVLFISALAGAFYAGRRYRGPIPYLDQSDPLVAASPTPGADDVMLSFERAKAEVDADPNAWLTQSKNELVRQGIKNPMESSDPQFLYLYGRASLLAGNIDEALKGFEASIAKADLSPSPANATIKKEATLGLAAVALKSETARPAAQTRLDEITRKSSPASPVSSPPVSPFRSP
jgi:protein phosphatase